LGGDYSRAPGLEPLGAFHERLDAFSPRVDVVENETGKRITIKAQ
jgi:hypothetical protein